MCVSDLLNASVKNSCVSLSLVCLVPPTEIVFLRTTVPAYGAYQFGTYDVMFEIQDGNAERAFDVIKRVENGVYIGEPAPPRFDVVVFVSDWLRWAQHAGVALFHLRCQKYLSPTKFALHIKTEKTQIPKAKLALMYSSCRPLNTHAHAHTHAHTHTHTHTHTLSI